MDLVKASFPTPYHSCGNSGTTTRHSSLTCKCSCRSTRNIRGCQSPRNSLKPPLSQLPTDYGPREPPRPPCLSTAEVLGFQRHRNHTHSPLLPTIRQTRKPISLSPSTENIQITFSRHQRRQPKNSGVSSYSSNSSIDIALPTSSYLTSKFVTSANLSAPPASADTYPYYNNEEYHYLDPADQFDEIDEAEATKGDYWATSDAGPQKPRVDDDNEITWHAMMSRSTEASSQKLSFQGLSKEFDDDDYEANEDVDDGEPASWYYTTEELENEGIEVEHELDAEEVYEEEEEEEEEVDDEEAENEAVETSDMPGSEEHIEQEETDDADDEPEYMRYKTAHSSVMEESSILNLTRRSDSLAATARSYQKDVMSRYDSQGYQQEVHYRTWETPSEDEAPQETVEEDEERPDTNESLTPYALVDIDAKIDVVHISGKGRCVFAKRDFRPGDIIFVESPTLVAIPKLDPPLWDALQEINSETPFDLPPVWHLAALYSLTRLPKSQQRVIMDKWVPDPNKNPGSDVEQILSATQLAVDPRRYERFLQAWRYNSFGHHVESEGLVLYNRISMIAHDCAASASWHYGDDDAFVLRARQFIPKGGEITISYIGDDDLFKATHIRQEKLSGWLFTCSCARCQGSSDVARGFRCPVCGAGTTFFKTVKEADQSISDGETSATPCTLCKRTPSKKTIEQYLVFEDAYISRLEETDKTDVPDVELVYSEAQRVFKQHWDTILFEAYRDAARWFEAAVHQQLRIQYTSQVIPKASYTLAWLYEELGDIYANQISTDFHSSTISVNGFQKNLLAEKYETAMNILFVLCGAQHDYTAAAHVSNESMSLYVEMELVSLATEKKKLSQVFSAPLEAAK